MEQGTIVKWNVKAGDSVSAGDVLADIETDKATMELESFDDGTVASIAVPEGQSVPVGTVILVLAEEGEDVAHVSAGAAAPVSAQAGAAADEGPPSATPVAAIASAPNGQTGSAAAGGRVIASPLARKIATERGVDLTSIRGTGPGGRITRKDVETLPGAAAPPPGGTGVQPVSSPTAPVGTGVQPIKETAPAPLTAGVVPVPVPAIRPDSPIEHRLVPLSNMRATIARVLVNSKATIPHYQVTVEADMDALLDLRRQLNDQLAAQGVKLSVNDFLVRACALAMHQHPFVNSRWVEQGSQPAIEILPDVNIGVAIALPEERGGGLVVATLRNTDRMGLRQISGETRRLAAKARDKGLSIEEMEGGTFTISNLGMFGVSHFTAIINPPNAAILAVGAARPVPVVRDGQVVAGHRMAMTISSDHRIIDGAMAARYLQTVRQLLESPATLLV